MEIVVGSAAALGVGLFASVVGFDRDRAFYPTVLIVIAALYVLFAVLGADSSAAPTALAPELVTAALFVILAVCGFKKSLWYIAGGLVAHGLWDGVHADFISNAGVPSWWPGFCAAYDITAGVYLALLLIYREKGAADYAASIRQHVEVCLALADAADRAGDAAGSFSHLERAHILAQASTPLHVRVHARMFLWGLRHRSMREIAGQVVRLTGAAVLTRFRAVPHGNTGGANVSAFAPMPIPSDLAALIARAEQESGFAPGWRTAREVRLR